MSPASRRFQIYQLGACPYLVKPAEDATPAELRELAVRFRDALSEAYRQPMAELGTAFELAIESVQTEDGMQFEVIAFASTRSPEAIRLAEELITHLPATWDEIEGGVLDFNYPMEKFSGLPVALFS